jgi:hypothetical protein
VVQVVHRVDQVLALRTAQVAIRDHPTPEVAQVALAAVAAVHVTGRGMGQVGSLFQLLIPVRLLLSENRFLDVFVHRLIRLDQGAS